MHTGTGDNKLRVGPRPSNDKGYFYMDEVAGNVVFDTNVNYSDGNWRLLSISQSNENLSTYKTNGDTRHTQTTATLTNVERVSIGQEYDGDTPGDYFEGELRELLIFDSELTDEQLSKVNYYLSKKWNLQASIDSDGDTIKDSVEIASSLNPINPADAAQDADSDGLTNAQEAGLGTNINNADSDGDSINDYIENQNGLNPLSAADASQDADGDGLTNAEEASLGTNINNTDTDSDGYTDNDEVIAGTSPTDSNSKITIDFSTAIHGQINNGANDLNGLEANLKLWLDAKNINASGNNEITNHSTISRWIDLSGNGHTVMQTDANSQPTIQSNQLLFDGVNDYFSGGDPYLYFDKDSILSSFEKTLDKNFSFEWGCDLSKDLVEKAKLLNLYKEVVVHDLSKPLPLPDKSFSTIYSNVSYWMNDKDTLFSEHKRILKDDGVALMTAQDPIIHEELALTTIARKYSKHLGHSSDPEWLKQLDRGRIDQTKGLLLNEEEWRGLFEKSGLEILYFGKFMSRDAYWHYDTDLRETFPSDVNLAQNLTKIGSDGQRLRDNWKKNRVDHYLNKWKPFFNDNNDWQKDIPRSWNFFVIKIKNNISWPEKI